MSKSVRSLLVVALLGTSALAANEAQARGQRIKIHHHQGSDFTISGTVEHLTDYRYRGMSQTAGDYAIQGSITASHKSGFYATFWATNLEDSEVAGSTEIDAGIGWTGNITPTLTLDTGLYLFNFPNGHVGHADIFEPFVALSTDFGPVNARVGVNYSWHQASLGGDDNLYLSTDWTARVPKTPVSFTAHLGYSDGALSPNVLTEKSMKGGYDYGVGAAYNLTKNLTVSATYTAVDGYNIESYTNDTVVGSLRLTF